MLFLDPFPNSCGLLCFTAKTLKLRYNKYIYTPLFTTIILVGKTFKSSAAIQTLYS